MPFPVAYVLILLYSHDYSISASNRNLKNTEVNRMYIQQTEWRFHVAVKHTNIASDNGLSPVRRQAITWTNAVISLIIPQGPYLSEFYLECESFH